MYCFCYCMSPPWLGWLLWNICVTNDNRYVPLVVNTSRSFPHSWLVTGFVTRLTRWVPLVEQELLTLLEHLSSPLVFSGVRVTRSLVLCVMFCRSLFVLFLLAIVFSVLLWFTDSDYLPLVSFGHCIVCSSLIYRFWLPPFGIFWSLCCLSFLDIQILITPLVS